MLNLPLSNIDFFSRHFDLSCCMFTHHPSFKTTEKTNTSDYQYYDGDHHER